LGIICANEKCKKYYNVINETGTSYQWVHAGGTREVDISALESYTLGGMIDITEGNHSLRQVGCFACQFRKGFDF
jgi:hypothetical protein